jgi:hypothetical protein
MADLAVETGLLRAVAAAAGPRGESWDDLWPLSDTLLKLAAGVSEFGGLANGSLATFVSSWFGVSATFATSFRSVATTLSDYAELRERTEGSLAGSFAGPAA